MKLAIILAPEDDKQKSDTLFNLPISSVGDEFNGRHIISVGAMSSDSAADSEQVIKKVRDYIESSWITGRYTNDYELSIWFDPTTVPVSKEQWSQELNIPSIRVHSYSYEALQQPSTKNHVKFGGPLHSNKETISDSEELTVVVNPLYKY